MNNQFRMYCIFLISGSVILHYLSQGSQKKHEHIGQKLTPSNSLFNRVPHLIGKPESQLSVTLDNRSLLIFLDISEYSKKKPGAITYEAACAIKDAACPILITISLLLLMIESSTSSTIKTPLLYAKMISAALSSLDTPQNWLIKQIAHDDGLIVLIPQSYFNTHKKFMGLTLMDKDISTFRDTVLKLNTNTPEASTKKFINTYFLKSFKMLFSKPSSTQWSIYLGGHGQIGETSMLAGLTLEDFSELLNFLNTKMYTKLLMYSSCYSAGRHQTFIYQEILKTEDSYKIKEYTFPIISFSIAENPTLVPLDLSFGNFVKASTSNDPILYTQLITAFIPSMSSLFDKSTATIPLSTLMENLLNFPLIRPPQSSYFIPATRIIQINENLVEAREPDKPLDLKTFRKRSIDGKYLSSYHDDKSPIYVLLKTSFVSFPLILNDLQGRLLFLADRKSSMYVFKKIISNEPFVVLKNKMYEVNVAFVEHFVAMSFTEQNFLIQELEIRNNDTKTTFRNVYIETKLNTQIGVETELKERQALKIPWQLSFTTYDNKKYQATDTADDSEKVIAHEINNDYLADQKFIIDMILKPPLGVQRLKTVVPEVSVKNVLKKKNTVMQLTNLQDQLAILSEQIRAF